jgi:hypothetical protein
MKKKNHGIQWQNEALLEDMNVLLSVSRE